MTEIKRFVSYIYMYDNGVKGNNVGFAKVDSRNGQCKIAVNIKGLEPSNGKSEKVYLFYRRQEKILGIYIGSFQIVNGIGEFHEQLQTQNIKGSNLSLDEMNGIFVQEDDKNTRVFASGWDDYAIVVNQFFVHNEEIKNPLTDAKDKALLHASEMEEKRKEPIIFFDRTWKEQTTATEQETETEPIAKEMTKTGNTEVQGILNRAEEEAVVKAEEREEDYGRGIEKQKADYERDVKRGQKMDIMQKDGEVHKAENPELEREKIKEENRTNDEQEIKEERGIYHSQEKNNLSELDIREKETTDHVQETDFVYSDFMQQVKRVETVIVEGSDGKNREKNEHRSDNKIKNNEIKENKIKNKEIKNNEIKKEQQNISNEAITENGLLWGTYVPSIWKEISWEEYLAKEQQLKIQARKCIQQNKERQKIKQPEEMQSDSGWQNKGAERSEIGEQDLTNPISENLQRPEETAWEQLCHQFPKIRAFVDEPESLCLKIDLRDLCVLPQENWGLGNNSFLLHGYYNFRYLILTQENGEVVLGIPGIYHPNEKVMASMFGFGGFKPVKICEKMLGQFGYWYKTVTL